MQTVILNGASPHTPDLDQLAQRLAEQAGAAGDDVRLFHLRDFAVAHCQGGFDCWVRTPGRCRIEDEGQQLERAVHDAQRLVVLTPVSFGGFGAQAKKAIDRLLPLILPFFAVRDGLTHHALRYPRLPHLVALGLDDSHEAGRAALFAAIVESAAGNLGLPGWHAALLSGDAATWDAQAAMALASQAVPGNPTGTRRQSRAHLDGVMRADALVRSPVARSRPVILLGSARPDGIGNSAALATFLADALADAGAPAERVLATDLVRGGDAAQRALDRLADADPLIVASPLYVDSLPYLATLALERLRERRAAAPPGRPPRLVGLLNCGFPEPEHLRFAIGQLRAFAVDAGYHFAGALPVGGGEAIAGRPLARTGGMTVPLRLALTDAARALATGTVVPAWASALAADAFLPAPLYRLAGWWGWHRQAHAHGVSHGALSARPFASLDRDDWEREARRGTLRARPLRVIVRQPAGADTITILFEDPAHDPLRHLAGQYLTLEVQIDGRVHRRAYSLSSAPGEGPLAITVKRVTDGVVSNWLHDHLAVGDLVRSHGPSGDFVPSPPPADRPRRLLLVGGGCGVVPLAAIARHVLVTEPAAQVLLVHGSSHPARAILSDALASLEAAYAPRFRLERVFEALPDGSPGRAGRLDDAVLSAILADWRFGAFGEAMVCGPDAMRASVGATLQRHGLPPGAIREERFVSPHPVAASDAPQTATLVDRAGRHAIEVAPGETLLDATLEHGHMLGFACLCGTCGACRVRIRAGADNVRLDEPRPLGEGPPDEVPACVTRLSGPIEFEIPAPT